MNTYLGKGGTAPRPGRFTPGEGAPCTHWIGGWVGPEPSGRGDKVIHVAQV